MTRPPIVIWDDGRGRFGPLTEMRAAFELRTGCDTIVERHRLLWREQVAAVWGPQRLAPLLAERIDLPVNRLPDAARVTLVSGRWALPDRDERPAPDEAFVSGDDGAIVMADVTHATATALLEHGVLEDGVQATPRHELRLVARPWDLLDVIDASIRHDLHAARLMAAVEPGAGTIILRGEPVVVDASARICPGAVIDSEQGPVIVLAGAIVRPHAVLCGPCVIGRGAVVAEHSTLRARTVIGPRCKVGGEISGCILQGSSNKVHDGFLGDSIVGEWVNLGAGTTGSNLLNTYGETTMRLDPDSSRERTGRIFLGAVIGDHVKTAIGTRLMTATSIGFGSMIAASTPPPTTVAPFSWVTDEATRTYRLDRFLETMTRVMARRNETPTAAMLDAVTALHSRAATVG